MFAIIAVGKLAATQAAAQSDADRLPDGVWNVSGYQTAFVSDRRGVRTYYLSSAGCVRGDDQKHREFLGQVGAPVPSDSADRLELRAGPTRYALERLQALPAACLQPVRSQDPMVNFEFFVASFAELYPAFDARGVDWEAAQAAARARVAAGEDLFSTLSDLVAPLRDDHVNIDANGRAYSYAGTDAPGTQPDGAPWTAAALALNLRDFMIGDASPLAAPGRVAANRKAIIGRLPNDVGYFAPVSLNNWAPLGENASASEQAAAASREMETILNELGDIRGLVIDLRINVGGHDSVALAIASRFAGQKAAVFTKDPPGQETEPYAVGISPADGARFTGPVAVLTSRNTVSAEEVLALALSALPNAHVLGQPTRGAFSDAVPRQLPNGWTYTLAAETYRTIDGVALEGVGLPPDEATPPAESSAPADLWGREIALAISWMLAAAR